VIQALLIIFVVVGDAVANRLLREERA
jgi:hypothetical protein